MQVLNSKAFQDYSYLRRHEIWHFTHKNHFITFYKLYVCCRKGSIVSKYNLYFIENSTIVGEDLDDTLKNYLSKMGCKRNGADCQLGHLVGVDITNSEAGGIQLQILV